MTRIFQYCCLSLLSLDFGNTSIFIWTGGQSFFSRKDSIRTIYTSLHNELKKVVATGHNALGGTAPHLEELLSHLSEQLCFFVQARMEIADFYEKMYTLSTQKFINSEELVNILESILKKYSSRSVLLCWQYVLRHMICNTWCWSSKQT